MPKGVESSELPHVLIIEDDRFNRHLYGDLLAAEAIEVRFASTAAQGFEAIRLDRPGLIVMDIELPDMDGLAATRLLKGEPRTASIPVLIVSAHALTDDLGDAYLRKPLKFPEFQETVRRLLRASD